MIAEIRDRNGRVLYRAEPVPQPRVDPTSGRLVGDILRNVVRWGTGRRANGTVRVGDVAVPVAGKTGTTNGYRNAAFAGFVPRYEEGWEWAQGFTVVTYVGYDDNRPMRRKAVKIQGSNGALPVWIGAAKALADAGLLGQPKAGLWSRLGVDQGFAVVPVADGTGLPLSEAPEEIQRSVLIAGGIRYPPVFTNRNARSHFHGLGCPSRRCNGGGTRTRCFRRLVGGRTYECVAAVNLFLRLLRTV